MGNYHVQGKFDLIDLVKYTDAASEEETEGILYHGIENYSTQGLTPSGNEERAGWVVFTQTEKDGQNIITVYAYDYNASNYGQMENSLCYRIDSLYLDRRNQKENTQLNIM